MLYVMVGMLRLLLGVVGTIGSWLTGVIAALSSLPSTTNEMRTRTARTSFVVVNANSDDQASSDRRCDFYHVFSLDNMYVCASEVEVPEHEAMLLRSSELCHGNLATFPPEIREVVETQYGDYYDTDTSHMVLLTIVSHSKKDEDSYPNVWHSVAEYSDGKHEDGFTSITIFT